MLTAASDVRNRESVNRVMTSLLCCVWGFTFAATFFEVAVENTGPISIVAAALPLGAVWAALERRRWARLVLIAQSVLAISLFVSMLWITANSSQGWGNSPLQGAAASVATTLSSFSMSPNTSLSILMLATATILWLCVPSVRDEFESRKKRVLTTGQTVIAASVIAFWTLTMIVTPADEDRGTITNVVVLQRRITLRY